MLQTRATRRPTASGPVPSQVAVPWRAELRIYVVLGVVALVAFCVGAGAKGVFGDEAYSLSTALRSWGSLWDQVRNHETNGLLYAALLRMWSELGDSLTWLRYLSALFAAGAVVATAALARTVASLRAAVIAGSLLIFNGAVLSFAQQIRGYSLVLLLSSLSCLVFVSQVRRPTTAKLVGWAVLAVLLAATNLISFVVIGGQLASLLFVSRERRQLGRWAVATAVVLPVPLVLMWLVNQHPEGQNLLALQLWAVRDAVLTLSGRGFVLGLAASAVLAALGLRAALRRGTRYLVTPEGWPFAFLMSAVLVPLAGLAVLSLVQPAIIGRYLAFALPLVAVFGAIGLDDAFRTVRPTARVARAALWVGTAVVVAGSLAGVAWWHRGGDIQDFEEAADLVFDQAQPGDSILFAWDDARLFFEHEAADHTGASLVTPRFPTGDWGTFGTGDQAYEAFPPTTVEALVQDAPGRVWVVVDGLRAVDADLAPLAQFDDAGWTVQTQTFDGEVDVHLYPPPGS